MNVKKVLKEMIAEFGEDKVREMINGLDVIKNLEVKMDKILWIEKGTGEESTFFSCSKHVGDKIRMDKIVEEFKITGMNCGQSTDSKLVYAGYKDDHKVFEMYAGENVIVMYDYES